MMGHRIFVRRGVVGRGLKRKSSAGPLGAVPLGWRAAAGGVAIVSGLDAVLRDGSERWRDPLRISSSATAPVMRRVGRASGPFHIAALDDASFSVR